MPATLSAGRMSIENVSHKHTLELRTKECLYNCGGIRLGRTDKGLMLASPTAFLLVIRMNSGLDWRLSLGNEAYKTCAV